MQADYDCRRRNLPAFRQASNQWRFGHAHSLLSADSSATACVGRCHQSQHGLPQTERAASEILTLPMNPQMKEEQAGQIQETMPRWCGDAASRE